MQQSTNRHNQFNEQYSLPQSIFFVEKYCVVLKVSIGKDREAVTIEPHEFAPCMEDFAPRLVEIQKKCAAFALSRFKGSNSYTILLHDFDTRRWKILPLGDVTVSQTEILEKRPVSVAC